MIDVKDLIFKYTLKDEEEKEESLALNNISLEIKEGSFVAILGANGSGKSTFAKHLNSLLLPSYGDVLVFGKNTKDESEYLNIRKNVGMVFQNPDNQIIGNVVEEDVAFGPENIGIKSEDIVQIVRDSLEEVGMLKYAKKSPNRLSGGQKQRVAIASVLAMRPKCIVFDESTAMLDPKGRKEVLKAAETLNKKNGISIIFITHHMEEVVDADRVIVLDKGKVVLDDVPAKIFALGDRLKDFSLDLPLISKLVFMLKKDGIELEDNIMKKDALVKHLALLLKEKAC